jgi:hypothetical protein
MMSNESRDERPEQERHDVTETSTCTHCGSTEPPDESGLCPVRSCRKFRQKNTAAMEHGARRRFTESMIARRDQLVESLLAERGGRARVDIVTQHSVVEFANLTVAYESVSGYLMESGPLTAAGRQRSAVRHALEIAARREKVAALLAASPRVEADDDAPPVGITRIERVIIDLPATDAGPPVKATEPTLALAPEPATPAVRSAPVQVPDGTGTPEEGSEDDSVQTETLAYGSEARERATEKLWREFGITRPRY